MLEWRRAWSRVLKTLGLVGWGVAAVMEPISAQTMPPPHWLQYASVASHQLESMLSNPESSSTTGLYAQMRERVLRDGPLVVSVWVSRVGKIELVAFNSLGNSEGDADLRTLLTGLRLSPPPRDMLQPMVLQLALSFPEED